MKRFIVILFCLFSLTACRKMIDLAPPSEMSEADFYSTEDDIEQAVSACYAALQSEGQYGLNYIFLMEIRSDNSSLEDFSKSGARYGDIEAFKESTANPVIEQAWRDSYKGIQRCNILLSRINDVPMNEIKKNTRKGEVYFLRALTYFNLVRLWGDVPLVTEEINDPFKSFGVARTPADAIYNAITDDLGKSIELLPAVTNDPGRVTQGAAKVLLGKVYLTLHRYNEASILLEGIINSGGYKLFEDFETLFDPKNENCSEIIFAVQYRAGSEGEGSRYANQFAPQGASSLVGGVGKTSGDNIPTQSLYKEYAAGDKRLKATIGTLPDGRYYNKKFLSKPVQDGSADNNFIVLRYADVLLMAAECRNELGYGNTKAFGYINEIRKRAGLKEFTASDLGDQASFRKYIAAERRRELAFENHRWFDLVRTGEAVNTMNNHVVFGTKLKMGAHQAVYPIPQRELDADPTGMNQNPGY